MSDRFLTDDDIAAEGIAPEQLVNPADPIDLSMERVLCPRHGEPFRARWPKGFPTMAIASLKTIMADPGFAALTEGEVGQINELLSQRPICERISSPDLMTLYIESGIGRDARCELCRQRGLGTPYTMARPGGTTETYHHVCFSCVVYRLKRVD